MNQLVPSDQTSTRVFALAANTVVLGGVATSGLAYNASTSAVQTALEGLSTIGSGNVAV